MKKLNIFLALFFSLATLCATVSAREIIVQQDAEIPVFFTSEAPVIDGELKEAFWKGVPVTTMYLSGKTTFATGRTKAAYPADVRLVNDGKFIYISVDAANPAAPGGKPGKNCWDRDGFEMVFSTVGGKASSACQVVFLDRFGQLQVGSRNASSIPLTEADIRWKTTQRQGAWTTEVAIPLDKLAIGPEKDFFALWGRANCEQDEITASAPNTNSFHDWQATRRCRLLNSPLALLLPTTFPCDSRVFKKPLLFRNFSSAPLSGELRVCRTAKAFDKLAELTFQPGDLTFDADFSIVNHSLPFWLELRGKDNSLLWRSAEYRYAGNSITGIIEQLPAYFKQSGHPYFQQLHQRLADIDKQMDVFKAEEKTLRRFLAPITSGNPAFLKKPYYFYTASSMAKHATGEILPEKIRLPQDVTLTAAKGETVNFQIRVLPLDKTVKGLTVKSFTIDGIPANKLAAYRVLDLLLPGDGIYPDPLSRKLPVDLTPEMNSVSYFFSATVPVEQKAGNYQGRVVLTDAAGNEMTCPVKVKVCSFALTDKPEMFAIFSYSVKRAYHSEYFPGKSENQLDQEWRNMIKDYGFMPFLGCSHPDYLDEEHMKLYTDWEELNDRFRMIQLGSLPWYYDWLKGFYEYNKNRKYQSAQEYMRSRIKEYAALADYLRAIGAPMENAFAYYDELESPSHLIRIGRKPDNSESISLLRELKAATGLKLFTCFCFPKKGDDNMALAEELVDLFLFNSNYFPENSKPLCDIAGLKARGKRIGWYWNVDKSPVSYNMVNWPDNVGLRTHFHKMHRLGIEFHMFWELSYIAKKEHFNMDVTPWVSNRNGGVDGMLAFPEDGQLIPSLRMELLRESYNDGRLITMAERLAAEKPAAPAAKRVREMLANDKFFANPRQCSLTADEVMKFHDELCELVEKLSK